MDRIANEQHWDRIHSKENLPWNEKSWCDVSGKTIRHFLEISKANRVLDFGCGFGRYQDIYASVCKSVTLVDISGKAIEESKRWGCVIRSDHSIKYLKSDLDGLVNEGLEFDLIVCWGVLHNYPENQWGDFIKSFSKLLRPGGYLLVGGWGREAARFESQDPVSDVTGLPTYSISDLYLDDALCSSFQILEQDVLDAPPTKCTDVAGHDIEFNAYQYLFCKKDSDETTKRHVELVKFLDTMREKIYLFQTIKYSFVAGGRDAVLDRTNSITGYWDEDLAVDILKGVIIATKESGSLTANLYDKVGDLANIFALKVFLDNDVIKDSDNEGDLKKLKDLGKVFTLEEEVSNFSVYNIASSSLKYVSIYDFLNKVEIDKISFGEAPFDLEKVMGQILHSTNKELHFYCFRNPVYKIGKGQFSDGVLFLYAAKALSAYEVGRLNRIFTRWSTALTFRSLMTLVKTEATKSAIGSIMSRNGSHNIGSHVLAALSHNVGTMPDDRVLYQYIQQRMDYTATATTDFPTWAGSAKLVNDLMRRFLSQRHLLDYIASSEGLHAFKFQDPNVSGSARWSQENTIKLHVSRQFNDGRKSVEFITYSDDPIAEKASNAANAKNSVKDSDKFSSDLAVALPGGIVGSHAFFTILENVIRNAAKHGWSKFRGENTNLDIYIDFTADDNGRAVLVDVYDGISNVFATYNDYWMVDKDLLNWFEECRDSLQRLTRDERTQISKFLSGKVAVDSLPGCYKKQYLLLQNRSVEAIEKISPWLVGEASRDGGIGNRLWISHTTDESLKRWYETYKESLLTHLSQPEQECIAEFLSGKCSVAKLPVFYQEQYACLLKYNENELKRIAGRLIGDVPIDGSLGNRLWMPLHHCQQIRIEKPFIDETGGLRRENWGLAEMKISAGYLNKRSISDIGGISKGIPIITPICANEDHLGYRFTIPRPRDVAFVCDTTGIRKDKIKVLQTLGVFVVPPPKDDLFVKPKNEGEEDWNYSFVVLPQFPQQADPHLPFRVLAKDNSSKVDMVPSASGFYDEVLKDLRNGTVTAEAVARKLKVKVINAWITYWGETRRKFDFGLPEVRLLTTEVGSSGNAGQGLVSNVDVWNFVFKEMFRSIVGNLLKDGELRPNIIADEVYWYLALIVAMPKTLDSNGAVFDFTGENEVLRKKINDGNAEADYPERELIFNVLDGWFSVLQGILRDTPDGLLQGFAAFAEKYKLRRMAAVDNKKGLEAVYAIALKYHAKVSEALGNNASDFKIRQGNPLYQGNAVNKSNGMPMFVKDLCSAYRESDVMLRKYEERIITLPCCFGEDLNDEIKGNSGGEGVDGVDNKIVQELGISLVYNEKDAEWNEGKSIAFMRHATSDDFNQDKMLYLEPLSGTQSYLNDMMMLGQNESVYQRLANYHLIAKMYETGLSRILIVDERVSKFLRNRPDEIKTFCRMGIWCVDETKFGEEKIGLDSLITLDKGRFDAFLRYAIVNGSSATNCEELPLRDRRFDILIIHQGLIDKWLPHVGTDCSKVESFIKRLKEFVPYVVITTGRGTPANIPDSARILPFSVVETALFKKYPEKMVLVDTIMNILPIGEHK